MISVVVPARDEERHLGACLEALLAQEGHRAVLEIVVVDDRSSDGTGRIARGYARRAGARLRVVDGPGRGVSAARNAGARAAAGELLLFTDADCRPVSGWAAALERAMAAEGVGGATGRQASDQDGAIARLVQLEVDEKQAHLASGGRVRFADTATAGYRAEVFRGVGGFDEALGHFEDTDLAFRVTEAGHVLVVAPGACVYHQHAESLGAYARRKARIGFWGAAVYRRHPGRVADDSRTPWAMRAQLALAPLVLLGAAGSAWWPEAGGLALAGLAGFLLSSLRFLRGAACRGRAALALAPVLLAVRALALDWGLAIGLARLAVGRHPAGRAS